MNLPTLFDTLPSGRGHHRNSRRSFAGLNVSPRQCAVLEALSGIGRAATDREVVAAMGKQDMNAARPRLTELVQEGVLVEVGDVIDAATGKSVRRVWFSGRMS